MLTVTETPTFTRLVTDYWTEDERGGFAAWIAQNPDAGDVTPGSGGCRKVRWVRKGMGKRGGACGLSTLTDWRTGKSGYS